MYYYLYKIRNLINGMIYIGIHKTKNLDDGYMGSGTWLNKDIERYGIENFEKKILKFFNNEEELNKAEEIIVNEEFVSRNDTYNLVPGGYTFTRGLVTVKDKDGNTFQVPIDDKRYLNSELLHITKNTVTVKDKDGKIFQVPIDDKRYLNGELLHITKNIVIVKDQSGDIFPVSADDERYLNSELIGFTSGTVTVKDKKDNCFRVPVDDERYLNGELKHIWEGKTHSEETKKKIGEKNSIHQKGCDNSQYDTCWIYNSKLQQNKKINKKELDYWLGNGWNKGRKIKW